MIENTTELFGREAEPGHCKADIDMLHSCSAHRDTATVCDYYEVVYSEQTMMKRYCFNRTQFNNDLHDVGCSKQKHLKRYKFMKTVVTDSNFDDSENYYSLLLSFVIIYNSIKQYIVISA